MEQVEAMRALSSDSGIDAALVARALSLLDEGWVADARELLLAALAGSSGTRFTRPADEAFEPLGDAELESAFDAARPETDSMIDADGIAFDAIRRAKLDAPESVSLPAPDSPFHTRTMADLLERQGDATGAHAIRAALGERAFESDALASNAPTGDGRTQAIETLERWLARLRGGHA